MVKSMSVGRAIIFYLLFCKIFYFATLECNTHLIEHTYYNLLQYALETIGLNYVTQVIFKISNVISRELDFILNHITLKSTTTVNSIHNATNNDKINNIFTLFPSKSIDCDVSNIIYKLSHCHSCVHDYK